MKVTLRIILFVLTISFLGAFCQRFAEDYSGVRLNQIQVIGTHNSYKKPLDPWVMEYLEKTVPEAAISLDYEHLPLKEQLDMGVRALEIDVFYDPDGGRYSNPYGVVLQNLNGILAPRPDAKVMSAPGFKVLHVQDIDYNSHHLTLISALREIRDWSDQNPDHLPIFISVEPKESELNGAFEFVKPLAFTKEAFDDLDHEVGSVFCHDKIITPDLIRGRFETLELAVLNNNWPLVNDIRGTVLFVLNAGISQRMIYLESHPSLEGRLMFVNSQRGNSECAVIYKNNARRNHAEIKELISSGYLVRTRADAGTKEARNEDYSRLEFAINSGAQIISTDYIKPDTNLHSKYFVRLPENRMERINPANARVKSR